jgi:hypothetical protein
MRALAGPAMLAIMVGGFFISRQFSADKLPPREFTALEFAGADDPQVGSCYSLSTMLVANRVTGTSTASWESPREGTWKLKLESVVQGYSGPVHTFRTLTFEQSGDLVRLVSVDASKDQPNTLRANIDDLLDAPNSMRSTPVDRCGRNGGTGYLYKAR